MLKIAFRFAMNRNLLSGIDPFSDNCYSYNIMASDNNVILNNSPMPPMLTIDQFRRMDQLAIEEYSLSIELMMENAGLQLARLVAQNASQKSKIMIGAGTGNNGGGGLVAARRLSGWGYNVSLNMPDPNLKTLPASQLSRAIAAGARVEIIEDPDFFVDAYFGFSQRLPLPSSFQEVISWSNNSPVKKISLDLPSGFNKKTGESLFKPDIILTLAAPKLELTMLNPQPEVYVADIGIPRHLYNKFRIPQPAFRFNGFIKIST